MSVVGASPCTRPVVVCSVCRHTVGWPSLPCSGRNPAWHYSPGNNSLSQTPTDTYNRQFHSRLCDLKSFGSIDRARPRRNWNDHGLVRMVQFGYVTKMTLFCHLMAFVWYYNSKWKTNLKWLFLCPFDLVIFFDRNQMHYFVLLKSYWHASW